MSDPIDTTDLRTQAEPAHIARATLALARVLAAAPQFEASLAAGSALAILSDVHPPYPPHPDDLAPLPVDEGLRQAFAALVAAADDVTNAAEVTRIAFAVRELRPLLWPIADAGTTP